MRKQKQNIVKVYLGGGYTRKDGTCRADDNFTEFMKTHENIKKYSGDLRSEKQHFKTVYKFYYTEYYGLYPEKYQTFYATYIEN